ncbi:MAG: glycosyltransferase family 2 protein [Lutimaribacter sp.]
MSGATKWGLVATIKAPPAQVLAFAAHHLALGAHRLFVYLDDENQAAFDALSAHPKCRPVLTNAAYWEKLGMKRRVKHQARQTENARHAYGRAAGQVAWLAHIDVDEFLSPLPSAAPIGQQLAALPPGRGLGAPHTPARDPFQNAPPRTRHARSICPRAVARLWRASERWFSKPCGGQTVLPHRGGGATRANPPHFCARSDEPRRSPPPDTLLLHCHAPSWQAFLHHFAYRHAKGSYRDELRPGQQDGLTLHQLFAYLLDTGGEAALQRFYATVCTATPTLLHGLQKHGLLYSCQMDLAQKLRQHFPNASHLADMVQ